RPARGPGHAPRPRPQRRAAVDQGRSGSSRHGSSGESLAARAEALLTNQLSAEVIDRQDHPNPRLARPATGLREGTTDARTSQGGELPGGGPRREEAG